jgi:hypothetical protein
MLLLIGVLVVLGIVVVVVKTMAGAGEEKSKDFPYEKEPSLFTATELAFLAALDQAVGRQVRIMGKARLADIVGVKKGLDKPAWQKAFNRIQSKHLDFVACDPKTMAVQFVIELDDKSHRRPDRQERDQFLDQVMQAVGIPIYHFPAQRSYSPEEIKAMLAGK